MKLILIRHGKTSASAAHVYCGSTDLALSAEGTADLQLKKQDLPYPDAAGFRIITSGMRRCETTLSLLYGALPHETVSDFREMDFGAFEMRSYAELRSKREYLSWIEGDNEANPTPGGESGAAMRARVLAATDRVLKTGRDTLIITHGGPIAAIMAYLFPKENKNRYEWQPEPGRGYAVDTAQDRYFAI